MINDHDHSGTVIVSLPEEMPVNETKNLEDQLNDDVNVAVDRVIMNGLYDGASRRADLKAIKRLKKS